MMAGLGICITRIWMDNIHIKKPSLIIKIEYNERYSEKLEISGK